MSNNTTAQILTTEEFNQAVEDDSITIISVISESEEFLTISNRNWYIQTSEDALEDLALMPARDYVFTLEKANATFAENIQKHFPDNKGIHIQDDVVLQGEDFLISIDAYEFQLDLKHEKDATVVDLRTPEECALGYVKGALNIELKDFESKIPLLQDTTSIYLYSGTGKRSLLASSILKYHGIHHFKNIAGGFATFEGFEIPINKAKKK